mgnify:CR=1 FL=1
MKNRPPAIPQAIAIVGLGSAGLKHYAAARKIFPKCRMLALSRSRPLKEEILYCQSVSEALDASPDIAIIASPAPYHLENAQPFIEAGVPTLIEKPMSVSGADIQKFSTLQSYSRIGVGYVLRQSKCVKAIKMKISDGAIGRVLYARLTVGLHLAGWRPSGDYRAGVSANMSLGGGALLELSHELDLAQWFFGRCRLLQSRAVRLSSITNDSEDYVEIMATFADGIEVSIHLDMIARPGFREGLIVGEKGQIKYDLSAHPAYAVVSDGGSWQVLAEDTARLPELFERQLSAFVSEADFGDLATFKDGRNIATITDAARASAVERRAIEIVCPD